MWKKTLILTIVCVFALVLVSLAKDKMLGKEHLQEMFERDRDVFIDRGEQKPMQEFLELKDRIEKLRSMAREAEAKAKHFRAEAKELEQTLKREIEHGDKAKHIDEMHAKLTSLKEAIERAKRQGQHDKAAELHERAMRMADEIKARQKEAGDKKFHEAEKRIVQLREMARQAKERGEMDKAEHLWAEAQELKGALNRELEHREKAKHMEEMHAELAELKEAIQHAKREGQHDKAAELHEKARIMAGEIKAHQREAGDKKLHEAEKRIVQLQEMARQAKQRGEMDKAEHLWAEAKELKGALKREMEHRETAGRMEKVHAQLAELKEAIEHAKREGQHDKADALRKKAEHLAEKIAMAAQQGRVRIKNEIEKLHAMAAKAKEAGYHEKAEALLQKARNLGRHVRDMAEGDKEKAHRQELQRLIEELRNEVKGLRQEVERLKQSR
jgi:hypothetical protein